MKKVFVSGCFDIIHSGHVQFFATAANYGEVHVSLASEETIQELKGRLPMMTEDERIFFVKSIRYVTDAFISHGQGDLNFIDDFLRVKPDILIVNQDGDSREKWKLCLDHGVEYKVLKRLPRQDLPARSSTVLRGASLIPSRIDLAGGWCDQPWVSELVAGPVITVCIENQSEFFDRSGMATSTRNKAVRLWGTELPTGDRQEIAKTLFAYDNAPGCDFVSGSQDSIGIVFPGINRLNYDGKYWPEDIISIPANYDFSWLENLIHLVPLGPRPHDYSVLAQTDIQQPFVQRLSLAAKDCWKALINFDASALGKAVTRSFDAQVAMFPLMMNEQIFEQITKYTSDVLGYKISGAGGGGFLILISEKPIKDALRVKIRN